MDYVLPSVLLVVGLICSLYNSYTIGYERGREYERTRKESK